MFTKLKTNFKKHSTKIVLGVSTFVGVATNAIVAHAADTDISGITGQITTSLTDSKAEFVTALGSVVAVAVGFFIVKFVVRQVISYFAKIASK